MKEAPIPENEKERLLALYSIGLLDTEPEARFDRITTTATEIFNVPISTLTLVDAKREWFKSCIGLPAKEGDRAISFCGHALLANEIFVIPDTKKDERFADNPMVVGKPFIRFYAGVPIVDTLGNRIGVFCIKDIKPRKFSKNDEEILKNLASWAELEINSRNLSLISEEQKKLQKKLMESEERFENIFKYSAVGVSLISTDGHWLEVNDALCRITGYSREELLSNKFNNITHPDDLNIGLEATKKLLSGKVDYVVLQKRYIHKKGYIVWVNLSIALVRAPDSEPLYFVTHTQDITKEKEIDKAKSEFVSVAAHQLRTPLTTISWYTEMLLNGDVDISNQKKYLEEVYKGNKTMIELVDTLLNVSRLELGTLKMKREPTNIKDVSESVLAELEPQILVKKITFEKTYNQSSPVIFADPKLFRIIFQNLLGNAIKYVGKDGNVRLDISTKNTDILISVWNDGIGIPKEAQPKIFTKLFRDDLAKEREPDGNGLGLYIVKSIVESSGGKIWFESDQDSTVFYVQLPVDGFKKVEE